MVCRHTVFVTKLHIQYRTVFRFFYFRNIIHIDIRTKRKQNKKTKLMTFVFCVGQCGLSVCVCLSPLSLDTHTLSLETLSLSRLSLSRDSLSLSLSILPLSRLRLSLSLDTLDTRYSGTRYSDTHTPTHPHPHTRQKV